MLLPSGISHANHVACEKYIHVNILTHIQMICLSWRERKADLIHVSYSNLCFYTVSLSNFLIFSSRSINVHLSCDWALCLFNPRLCLWPTRQENVSFVMRRLVLLWCIFSQTWRNLVIHQLFFLPPPLSLLRACLFNFSLEILCIFFFSLPAFKAMKILLRAIDKMWHITFCAVHYFVGKYKRDKAFFKTKACWMLCRMCKMRTLRHSHGPEVSFTVTASRSVEDRQCHSLKGNYKPMYRNKMAQVYDKIKSLEILARISVCD